ncbi:MAG: addiction module antidote protein, HigA family [Candidatus Tokpelaia sp.]|nr:MAG: addiction module antidote protein, HigA family [Candidatus Tokpelaia sp.]KAA6207110.1 MAG: addiction module antidote protein, HigA family [Candidatus Tokpelaia sp.]
MARRIVPNYHPGEVLQARYLFPAGLSAYALARKLHVSPSRIERIIAGRLPVTIDTALRLARFFDTDPHYWLQLQQDFDLSRISIAMQPILAEIRPLNSS